MVIGWGNHVTAHIFFKPEIHQSREMRENTGPRSPAMHVISFPPAYSK